MIVSHIDKVELKPLQGPGVEKAFKKVCITPAEGWEGYVMRVFDLEAGGKAPQHKHPWPHINYILKGEGVIHLDGVDNEVEEGSFAYIPADTLHQIRNRGNGIFQFICIVPEAGEM
ncbi:MAG: cupin domain-containing protein [Negativicutes bacterium]|nr:cupin domain-containing protein [Negativicutes bacterium]